MDKCIIRETHRAKDAIKRYKSDRDGLLNWMDKFYNQHREYMGDQMILQAKAINLDEMFFNNYLDEHITLSRFEIFNAFDMDEDLNFTFDAETSIAAVLGN